MRSFAPYQEMAAEEKMKQGMSPKDALRAVRLERGSFEITKEVVRSGGRESFVETCWQDLRYAQRRLRMVPTFTIATVLTLALGMGATTSIFTLVHAVLLKSLPVANPGELYRLGKESRCCYQGGYSQEAALLTAALQTLENNDLGFAQDRRIVANIDPRLAGYRSDQLPTLYRRIHDSIASIPGVSSVALEPRLLQPHHPDCAWKNQERQTYSVDESGSFRTSQGA